MNHQITQWTALKPNQFICFYNFTYIYCAKHTYIFYKITCIYFILFRKNNINEPDTTYKWSDRLLNHTTISYVHMNTNNGNFCVLNNVYDMADSRRSNKNVTDLISSTQIVLNNNYDFFLLFYNFTQSYKIEILLVKYQK